MRVTAGVVLATVVALVLFVAGPASAGTGGAPLRSCGQIPTGAVWSVKATPGVGCRKARQVIKASGFGERSSALGFHCTSGREGQYGFAVKCHKGEQTVTGTTGV
jgi:hypothetical protein